jgi:ribosomal protein L30E
MSAAVPKTKGGKVKKSADTLTSKLCALKRFKRDCTEIAPCSPGHQVGQILAGLQEHAQAHAFGQRSASFAGDSGQKLKFLVSAKLVLVSGNCQPLRRSELEYYAMLSKTPVHLFQGTNVALGTAAGKVFRVGCVRYVSSGAKLTQRRSVMAIVDAGDSDILSIAQA